MRSALVLAFALAFPLAADAFNLTGSWQGKYTCRAFDGTKFSFNVPGTLEITQNGTDIDLQLPFTGGADVYRGISIDATGKPEQGAVYFAHCGISDVPGTGDNNFDETGFALVKTKENGDGTFKAATTFFLATPPLEAASCKWSYKRVSTTNPNVVGCPD